MEDWLKLLFSGAGGALLVAFLAWGPKKAREWGEAYHARKNVQLVQVEKRVKSLEDSLKLQAELNETVNKTMKRVIDFIEGQEDPFRPGVTNGGLLRFMTRIEQRLGLTDEDFGPPTPSLRRRATDVPSPSKDSDPSA